MKNMHRMFITLLILLYGLLNLSYANNYNSKTEKDKIITDPVSGDKVICNELLVVFKDNVDPSRQAIIVADIDGKIISEMPSLGICQISFNNPSASIQRLQNLRKRLLMDDNILYVQPHKVGISKINDSEVSTNFTKLKRRGNVNFNAPEVCQKSTNKESIHEIVCAHAPGLNACVEKNRRVCSEFHGEITFYLEYSQNGEVSFAKVMRSTIKDYKFTGCLVNKIKKWNNLPQSKSEEVSQLEFTFKF